jgi:hypothetical protein
MRKKLVRSLAVSIAALFLTGGLAFAERPDTSVQFDPKGDIQAQIDQLHQKVPHSARKAAATRLKPIAQQEFKKHFYNQDGTPKGARKDGYTGEGHRGGN